MVIQVIALILVMLFPQIALWFPNYLFGPWGLRRERARREPE